VYLCRTIKAKTAFQYSYHKLLLSIYNNRMTVSSSTIN